MSEQLHITCHCEKCRSQQQLQQAEQRVIEAARAYCKMATGTDSLRWLDLLNAVEELEKWERP